MFNRLVSSRSYGFKVRDLFTSALMSSSILISAGSYADSSENSFDSSTIRAGAAALASFAPPPLNGTGVQLVNGLWPSNDSTEFMLDELNDKLDSIQGSLSTIQDTLSTLRSDIRSDFESVFANRTYMDIKATIEHVQFKLRNDYSNSVGTRYEQSGELIGIASEYLNDTYLHDLESTLSESIDYFLFDSTLSPQHQMTTAADFLLMSELHLMLIQEQIKLFKSDGYICLDGDICQPQDAMLETFINNYYDRVDLYSDHLQVLADVIKDYRMGQISGLRVTEEKYSRCQYINGSCIPIILPTGRYVYTAYDLAVSATTPIFNESTWGKDLDYANSLHTNYKNAVEADIDAVLDAEILGAMNDLDASKEQYQYVEGTVAQGCVALYLDDNFSGDYKVICKDTNYKALDSYKSTIKYNCTWLLSCSTWEYTVYTLGNDWDNNISSIKLGQDTELTLYTEDDYAGYSTTYTGKAAVGEFNTTFNNNFESLKFQSFVD